MPAASTATGAACGDIELGLLQSVPPMLESALLAMLNGSDGITGYVSLGPAEAEKSVAGKASRGADFLVMVRAGRPKAAFLEWLEERHVPVHCLGWLSADAATAWESATDNLEMLVGLLNGHSAARQIGATRRAERRAA